MCSIINFYLITALLNATLLLLTPVSHNFAIIIADNMSIFRHQQLLEEYMSKPLVQLSFALTSLEHTMFESTGHNMACGTLIQEANSQHQITLQCVLPEAAHEGDIVSLSATQPYARKAQYYTQTTLDLHDLARGQVNLTLDKIAHNHNFVMQITLHGKHRVLKNNLQFDMYIRQFAQGYTAPTTEPPAPRQRVWQYFANMGAALLSLF